MRRSPRCSILALPRSRVPPGGPTRAGAAADQGPPPLLLPRDVHPAAHQRAEQRRPGRPTGRELVYSMQGSLWRQRLGQRRGAPAHRRPRLRLPARLVARWTPDRLRRPTATTRSSCGCSISRPATPDAPGRDGAVNLEPRWSPDGTRHRLRLDRVRGTLARLRRRRSTPTAGRATSERITEDRDSGLPRYYYGAVRPVPLAHLVARRQGADPRSPIAATSGARAASGAWRREPGAPPREIRYEETTWKARPTGAATASASSTAPISAASGTSSGS